MKPSLFGKGKFQERFARFGISFCWNELKSKNMIEKDDLLKAGWEFRPWSEMVGIISRLVYCT